VINTAETFDLDAANKTIRDAFLGFIKIMIPAPESERLSPEDARRIMNDAISAMSAGSNACGEVTRLRNTLSELRDKHRPRPSAHPSAPGAICAPCSLHGVLITWPCETWTTTEQALTHGQS